MSTRTTGLGNGVTVVRASVGRIPFLSTIGYSFLYIFYTNSAKIGTEVDSAENFGVIPILSSLDALLRISSMKKAAKIYTLEWIRRKAGRAYRK